MGGLVYGADYHLRNGEEVLAGFREGGPYGRIVVGDRDYEIAHRGRKGWHFRLVERESGEDICEYDPYPLVRGGRFHGSCGLVKLRGVPLRVRRWAFASESGWRMDAEVSDIRAFRGFFEGLREGSREWRERSRLRREGLTSPPSAGDDAAAAEPKAMSHYQVELRGSDFPMTPDASMLLAFGCWILAERQSVLLMPINPAPGG
jgi:hypothetical protein